MEETLFVSVVGLVILVVAIGFGLLINGLAERKTSMYDIVFRKEDSQKKPISK